MPHSDFSAADLAFMGMQGSHREMEEIRRRLDKIEEALGITSPNPTPSDQKATGFNPFAEFDKSDGQFRPKD